MRVFVAGASGAIGSQLVPQLIAQGHEVVGTFRTPQKPQSLRAAGAHAMALDLLDADAVLNAVLETRPNVIVQQATALADARFSRKLDRTLAATIRLRTDGTDALLATARAAGVHRFIAQSFPPYRYAREGGPVKTEADPSTRTRRVAPAGPTPRCATSIRPSRTPVGSSFATAVGMAPPTTG